MDEEKELTPGIGILAQIELADPKSFKTISVDKLEGVLKDLDDKEKLKIRILKKLLQLAYDKRK